VAKLEAGHRGLDAAEFLFLPEMLNFALMLGRSPRDRPRAVVELADVLPEEGWVAVTRHNRTLARALRQIARGQLGAVVFTDLDVPVLRRMREQADKALLSLHQLMAAREPVERTLGMDVPVTVRDARRESLGEAEQKAARKLGIPAATVALAAQKLWGHSLTKEREERLAPHPVTAMTPRQLQALRGRITRVLLHELQHGLVKNRRPVGARRPPGHRQRERTRAPQTIEDGEDD
jgi:hypothetical protein